MSFIGTFLLLLFGVSLTVGLAAWVLDATAQRWLFSRVSYTNSPAFDAKLKALRERKWNLIVTGSSEVRWGISPDDLDAAFAGATPRAASRALNIGLDGFTPGLSYLLLNNSRMVPRSSGTKVLVVGVNLAEPVSVRRPEYTPKNCTEFQKPIFESYFAADNRLTCFCCKDRPRGLSTLMDRLPLLRYRKAIRDLIDEAEQPAPDPRDRPNGFHAHASIASAEPRHYETFNASLPKLRATEANRFGPVSQKNYRTAVSEGGLFEAYRQLAQKRGWLLAIFVLPSNPVFYRVFEREQALRDHSMIVRSWAERNAIPFIDLGVKSSYDPAEDFSDYRHLSEAGARKYSRELGATLAAHPRIVAVLSGARGAADRTFGRANHPDHGGAGHEGVHA